MSLSDEAPLTVKDLKSLLGNTIIQVADIEKTLEHISETQKIMAMAHESIARAAESMADTFKRAELRQNTLESTNQSLYKDKGVSPNVFFLVTGTLCTVIVLGAIWVTDTSIKATLTSFEAGKEQAKQLSEVKQEIIEGVKKEQ